MLYNEYKGTLNQKMYKLNHFIVKTIEKNYQNKKVNGRKVIRSTSQDFISNNKNIKYHIILPGKKRRGISDDSSANSNTNRTESSISNKNESNIKGGKIRLRLNNHIIKKDPRKYYLNHIEYIINIQKIWKGFYLRKRINKFLKTYYSIFIFISHFKNLLLKQLFYFINKIQVYDINIYKKYDNSLKTSSSISKRASIDNEKYKKKLEIETISSRSSEGKIFNSLYNNEIHGLKFFDDNLKEINESNFYIFDKDLSNEKKKENLEYKKLYKILINKIAILEEKNKQSKLNNKFFISNKLNNFQIIPDLLTEKKNNKIENGLIEINRDDNTEDNSYLLSDKKTKYFDELFISNQQNNFQILPLKNNNENNFQINSKIKFRRINNGNISILLEKKNNQIIDNSKIISHEHNIHIKPSESLMKNDNNLFKNVKIFLNLQEERKISDKIIDDKRDKCKNFDFENLEIEIKNISKKELYIVKSKTEFIKILGKKKPILRKSRVENLKFLSKKKPNILKKSKIDYFKILKKKKIIIDKIRNESFIILSEKFDENIYKKDEIINVISNNENFNIISKKKVLIEKEKKDNFNILSEKKNQIKNIINDNNNNLTTINKKDCEIKTEKNKLFYENKIMIEKISNENFNLISKQKQKENKSNFEILKLDSINISNKNNIKDKKENIIFEISKNEDFHILNKQIYNENFINNYNLRYSRSINNFEKLNNENNNLFNDNIKLNHCLEKLKTENTKNEIIRNELIYIEGKNKKYKSKEIQTINKNNIINNNKEKEFKFIQESFQIITTHKFVKKRMPSGIIFKNKVIKTEWTKLPFAIEKYAKKFNNRLVCLLIVNYLRKKTKQIRIENFKNIILKIIIKQNDKILKKYFYKFQFRLLLEKKLFELKSEINKNNDLLFDLSFNETKQLIESNNPKSKDNSLNYINFAEIDYTNELEEPIKKDLKDKIKKIDISSIKTKNKISIPPLLSPISKRKTYLKYDELNNILNIKEKKIKKILQKKILKNTFSKWKKEIEDNISINDSFSFSMSHATPRTIRIKSKKTNKDVSVRYINKNSNVGNIRSISIFSSFNDSFLSLTNTSIKKGMKVVHKIIDYKGKIKNIDPNLYTNNNNKLNKSNLDIKDNNLLNKILSMNKAKKCFVKWKKISKKNKRKFINVIVDMIKCLFSNNILMYESLKVNPNFQIEKIMLIWYRKSKKISKKKNKKYY